MNEQLLAETRRPSYWMEINPTGTISEYPWSAKGGGIEFEDNELAALKQTLVHEGYFQTKPVINQSQLAHLIELIDGVMSAGHPPAYALVYDEFFAIMAGLSKLISSLLGQGFLMVPDEPDVYFIPTSDEHSGSGPHRDTLRFPDMYTDQGVPKVINIWIPITDSTTQNSCMHVIPAHYDGDYKTPRSMHELPDHLPNQVLQKVRALPAAAGSILGWSTELIHWGGMSSDQAELPRLSFAMYFQRGDCAKYHPSAMAPTSRIPFDFRLYCIEKVWADPDGKNIGQFLG